MTKSTLDLLLEKQAQIEARIKSLKAKDISQKRKDDTKKKILAGAYLLQKHEKEGTWDELLKDLEPFLIHNGDRMLFGLPDKEGRKSK